MTNEELQKAFEAGYAAAKALYSLLEKEGIEVTEADIKKIVEEVLNELTAGGETIDQKYLPGVCLPVVEFETVLKSGAALTEAENVAIVEALNTGYPVVVRFKIEDGTTSTAVAAAAGRFALAFRLGMIDFIIQSTGENGMNFTVITGA